MHFCDKKQIGFIVFPLQAFEKQNMIVQYDWTNMIANMIGQNSNGSRNTLLHTNIPLDLLI